MKERVSVPEYVSLISRELQQSTEKVFLAVSLCGRDFKKIKALLYRHYEPETIPFIAKTLDIKRELAELAYSCCGCDLKKIMSFTSTYEYGICTTC